MKNFLRALRYAWPYRYRLVFSVACALIAALCWGLNFTSIYPVLKLLHTGKSPLEWVDARIAGNEAEVRSLTEEIKQQRDRLTELEANPPDDVEKRKRDLNGRLAKLEA